MIRPNRVDAVEKLINQLVTNRARYELVADKLGIPWHVVAVIQNMESSQDFTCHLHNGDPLSQRTVQVPIGATYSKTKPTDPDELARAITLQTWLTSHTGIFLKPDGIAGPDTSAAFMAVSGHHLTGDPRKDA